MITIYASYAPNFVPQSTANEALKSPIMLHTRTITLDIRFSIIFPSKSLSLHRPEYSSHVKHSCISFVANTQLQMYRALSNVYDRTEMIVSYEMQIPRLNCRKYKKNKERTSVLKKIQRHACLPGNAQSP